MCSASKLDKRNSAPAFLMHQLMPPGMTTKPSLKCLSTLALTLEAPMIGISPQSHKCSWMEQLVQCLKVKHWVVEAS